MMRHPVGFGGVLFFIPHPTALSGAVSYAVLVVSGQIGLVSILVVLNTEEERVDLRRWGDEYRRYQEEAPMYNFVKGLWNLRKRR